MELRGVDLRGFRCGTEGGGGVELRGGNRGVFGS